MKVSVTDSPISADSLKFSMFKAVLSGKVKCLSNCGDVDVVLTSTDGHSSSKTQKVCAWDMLAPNSGARTSVVLVFLWM